MASNGKMAVERNANAHYALEILHSLTLCYHSLVSRSYDYSAPTVARTARAPATDFHIDVNIKHIRTSLKALYDATEKISPGASSATAVLCTPGT